MAREQAVKARKERNAALVELMLLAAMADGKVTQLELQTMLRRVLERPEFEGTKPEELNALEGVTVIDVDLRVGDASLVRVTASRPVDDSEISAAIDEAGYTLVR